MASGGRWWRSLPGWSAALFDQGLASLATVSATIAVGRSAGAEELGRFSAGLLTALLACSVHQALVAQPMPAVLAGEPAGLRAAWLARLTAWHRHGGVAAFPFAALLAWWWPLAGLVVVLAALRAAVELRRRAAYLEARPWQALAAGGAAHAPACLLLAAPLLGWRVDATLALGVLAAGAAAGCLLVRPPGAGAAPAPAPEVAAAFWRMSRWHLASFAALWGTNHAIGLLLAASGDLAAAGQLHAARTMLGLPLAGMAALDAWFQPRAREAWVAGGGQALRRVGLRYAGLALAGTLPCALLMVCWAEPLASLLLSDGAAGAGAAVALAAIPALLAVPDRLVGLAITARQSPQATAAGFALCLAATAILLPMVIAHGAAGCMALLAVNAAIMVLVPALWLAWRWRRLP
jgi:O-antigen/teichoic acid export membrane protein